MKDFDTTFNCLYRQRYKFKKDLHNIEGLDKVIYNDINIYKTESKENLQKIYKILEESQSNFENKEYMRKHSDKYVKDYSYPEFSSEYIYKIFLDKIKKKIKDLLKNIKEDLNKRIFIVIKEEISGDEIVSRNIVFSSIDFFSAQQFVFDQIKEDKLMPADKEEFKDIIFRKTEIYNGIRYKIEFHDLTK